MADDKQKTFEDRETINLSESYEVQYWKKEFGTDSAGLRELEKTHGKSVANIRKELAK
jgi:hypothetical protein